MVNRRRNGSRHGSANPLAAAPLCVEEQYYHELAHPLMRQGAAQRTRNLTALAGPALTVACALFIALSLILTTPARMRQASALTPLQARLASMPPALAFALLGAAPLLAALALASLWAHLDLARERSIRKTLQAKLRLARGYRAYLTGLLALTQPLTWPRLAAPEGATNGGPAVLVALTLSHNLARDEAPKTTPSSDERGRHTSASHPIVRYGWEASVDRARRELPQRRVVESVAQALADSTAGAILLCGGEGAGKSTLMRHTAHAQAQAQLQRTRPGGRIPFYADLGWLEQGWPGGGAASVEVALATLAQRIGGIEPEVARELAHAMLDEPALLLFDELNTLPGEQRERVASSLAALLVGRGHSAAIEPGANRTTQVALGSRSYTAPLGDGPANAQFQWWEVEPLAYPMGRLALVRGALASHPDQAPAAAEALLRALATPQTETWLTQPLALTLAAVAGIGAPNAAPCRARADLYAAAVGASLSARLAEWEDDERRAMLRVAGELALWLHIRGRRVFRPGAMEIDQRLLRLPDARLITARAGMASPSDVVATLSGLCEACPDGLTCFSLPTLHSFLAGSALARQLADELPSPLAPDALSREAALACDSRRRALALAWSARASARWSDTLLFMCGALCSSHDPSDTARRDIAIAWLRALLDQRDEVAETALSLAALSLPELRGEESGARLAADIATRLDRTLQSWGAGATHAEMAAAVRADAAVMADPVGRRTALDLLRARLLGADEQEARLAAQALGALGQAGVRVAPLLGQLLGVTVWASRAAVAQAIGALGPAYGDEAIPALIAARNDQTPIVRRAVTRALGEVVTKPDGALIQTLLAQLSDRDGDERAAAATALGRLGGALDQVGTELAQTVADSLARALADGEVFVQVMAALALGATPSATQHIPTLIESLEAVGWNDRAAAALALGTLGPSAEAALPALLALSGDDTLIVRTMATRTLAKIGPQRADVVSALVARLADEASETRIAAADALAQMDSAMPALRTQAWPALLDALRDPSDSIRRAAGRALGALGATGDPHIATALSALLDDPRGYVRAAAALPLETLGGAAARNLPDLIASLSGVGDEVCLVATDALGMFGAAARAATPTLTTLLNDKQWEIRCAALRALRRIEPRRITASYLIARMNDPEAPVRLGALAALDALDRRRDRLTLPAIQQRLLDDADSRVRAAAATALGRMGPRAATTLPALTRALHDSANEAQRAAALAIGALQPTLPGAITQLIEQLSDHSPGVRAAVALAFGALGPRAAATTEPELLTLLKDEDPVTRAAAAEAVGLLGPLASAAARQALLLRLDDADGETRAAAARTLGRVGAGDGDPQTLCEALGARTHDKRYVMRRAAVEALATLGPAATLAALPRLLELLGDPDMLTRRAVIAALATLDTAGQAQALPTLRLALNATLASGRAAAAQALAAMPTQLQATDREALIGLLADPAEEVRTAAALAIGSLSITALRDEAPPDALGRLLADEAWQTRAAAAGSLGAFGARVSPADCDALRATLADPDETARRAAALALTQVDPNGAKALVGELLGAIKTRRATGVLAPLAQRRELEVYTAMERSTWPIAQRVASWLGGETHWSTVIGACALIERWRYAPMAARQQLLRRSERSSYPAVRLAASMALRAVLAESPDLDEPHADDYTDDTRDLLDIHERRDPSAHGALAPVGTTRPRDEASASNTQSSASDRPALPVVAGGDTIRRLSGDEGKTA